MPGLVKKQFFSILSNSGETVSDIISHRDSSTRVPTLDEALSNIHGTQTSYTHQSSFLSGISRNCTSSPKPPGGSSGPDSLRALSAAPAYGKLMQERSLSDLKTSQIFFMGQLQENLVKDQEQLRMQEHGETHISHAESLSSLDSLENEVPQNGYDSLDPTKVHDTRRLTSPKRQLNCPSPSSNHCPPNRFLEKVVSQLPSSSRSPSPSSVENESVDEDQGVQHFLKAAEQCNITGQFQVSSIQATTTFCQKQVLAADSGHTEYQYGTATQENISKDKTSRAAACKMQKIPDNTHLEYASMTQQSNSGSGELSKCTKDLSEMQAAKKASRCINSSACDLNKTTPGLEKSALQPGEAEKSFRFTKKKQDEKYKRAECPSDEYVDSRLAKAILPKFFRMTAEPDKKSVYSLTSPTEPKSSNVHFLKGILKKQLKCIGDGAAKVSHTPGQFTFSKQVAMAIRDSLELSRAKGRDPESTKCIKKKLRWFDEVNSDGGVNEEKLTKELSNQAEPACRFPQPPSWYMNKTSGIPENDMTTSGPAEPNSVQQAWSDVSAQKGKQQEPTGASRIENAASYNSGGLVPRWAHSARSGSGTVSSQMRRGTTIRPQSSNQVQHIVRTQGKILVPRPPPRSEITGSNSGQAVMYISKTGNSDEGSQSKAALAVEQVVHKDCPRSQSVSNRHSVKKDQGTILAPDSSIHTCMYETVSKSVYALCQSRGQPGSGNHGFQKGFLDRTPTDEEISLLWNGVRSALASKDGDSGSLQIHNEPLSALPQTHANLSHVTVNGDSMFRGVKAVTRMGGLFLSSTNVRSPVRRPPQENDMVKDRSAALAYRKPPVLHQASVPITDRTVPEQGSDVVGVDEQVAVDSAQFQRAAELLQSQRGLGALSLEEHKLLQSLDRLNHRLQYVQDAVAGNPALKGIVISDPAYNQSPQPGEGSCATLRRYHEASAESRTHPHRRY